MGAVGRAGVPRVVRAGSMITLALMWSPRHWARKYWWRPWWDSCSRVYTFGWWFFYVEVVP